MYVLAGNSLEIVDIIGELSFESKLICVYELDHEYNRHFCSTGPGYRVGILDQSIFLFSIYVLSRASKVGSPTNPPWTPGSDKMV